MNKRHNQQASDSEPLFFDGDVEVRSNSSGDGEVIFGYFAKYNQRSRKMKSSKGVEFVEVIKPGAFDRSDFNDVQGKFNHETFLSSRSNLRYGFDSVGGFYEIPVDPLDPDHVSAVRKIKRGDAKGSSFEFGRLGPNDQTITDEGGVKLREINHFPKIWDFGPVVDPAYPSTSTFIRSLDDQYDEDIQTQQHLQNQIKSARAFLAKALS